MTPAEQLQAAKTDVDAWTTVVRKMQEVLDGDNPSLTVAWKTVLRESKYRQAAAISALTGLMQEEASQSRGSTASVFDREEICVVDAPSFLDVLVERQLLALPYEDRVQLLRTLGLYAVKEEDDVSEARTAVRRARNSGQFDSLSAALAQAR